MSNQNKAGRIYFGLILFTIVVANTNMNMKIPKGLSEGVIDCFFLGVGLWCLAPLFYFSYIVAVSFIGEGN